MTDRYTRYAVYYAPPADHPLGMFGNAWLGRDPATGTELPRPEVAGLYAAEIEEITATPARYGFHGTLKPPFTLAEGTTFDDLDRRASDLAATIPAFQVPVLKLARIGHFVALVPAEPSAELANLAAAFVRGLDGFRGPQSEAMLAKRRGAGLSARQEEMLRRWGYPYVLEEFRFHLTLSGKLEAEACDALVATLAPVVAPILAKPMPVGDVALFGDPGDGGRFRLLKRYPLA